MATNLYSRFPSNLRAGTLHPLYVVADANRNKDLEPTFWRYEDAGDFLLHGFHLAEIPSFRWKDIQSPYGYGGLLSSTEDPEFLDEADRKFCNWAIERGVIAEFIRFHPMLKNWRFYRGEVVFDRFTVWIDCTIDNPCSSSETRHRTAVRKAQRSGVRFEWLAGDKMQMFFPDFYRTSMRLIDADSFYIFNDKYFSALFSLPFVRGATAFIEEEVVAAAVFLTENIGEYHLSAKTSNGAKLAASNLIIDSAAMGMRSSGIKSLHLGGGASDDERDSLYFFKKGFSKKRAEFRFGRRVFLISEYEELKRSFPHEFKNHPERTLFYR